jgi:hypothetical protein
MFFVRADHGGTKDMRIYLVREVDTKEEAEAKVRDLLGEELILSPLWSFAVIRVEEAPVIRIT